MAFPRQVPNIPARSSFHELREDVVYDEVNGVPLRFDHYRTLVANGPAPAVVVVHGGGWMNGDPSQAAGNALHFARRGISTVSISYRLAPAHHFPAPLDDVRRGLRWVRANATALGIDPERLVLLGLSAGAHLAVLAHLARGIEALTPDLPAALRDVSENVRGVMAHYGPYDLAKRAPYADGTDPIAALLGPRSSDESWVRTASPIHHAANASAPMLLIHGTKDDLVSHRQSERLHRNFLEAGRSSELLLLDGAPHAFQVQWRGEANQRANATMDTFLDRVLA